MEQDQASRIIQELLELMVRRNGSDLFITADFPPAIKLDGAVTPVAEQPFLAEHTAALARAIMNPRQMAEFEQHKECNFAIQPPRIGVSGSAPSSSRAGSAWSCGPSRPEFRASRRCVYPRSSRT